jgi:hypothetical protein
LVGVLVVLGVVAGPVSADQIYVSGGSFAGGGGAFVSGVAVNSTSGDVYVARQQICDFNCSFGLSLPVPSPVAKFDANGATPATFGSGNYTGVTVNPVNQQIYAFNRPSAIQGFTVGGAALGAPFPIAVDSSTSVVQIATDSAGNVFYPNVADDTVEKFDPVDGSLDLTIAGSGANTLVNPVDVAIDAVGNVYVVDSGQTRIQRFDALGGAPTVFKSGGAGYSVDVNRATGEVFVGSTDGGYRVRVYNHAGTQLDEFGVGVVASSADNRVAVNFATKRAYVAESSGTVRMFNQIERPPAPTVATQAASGMTYKAATLNATVNPGGNAVTTCRFEWGKTTAYGQTAPCVPASPGSGSSPVAVSANIGNLDSSTTYHFRIVAGNVGASANGDDMSFDTLASTLPPVATTGAMSNLTATSATVAGTVNPEGSQITSCRFEYGPTLGYGQSVACSPTPGAGPTNVVVTANLAGLDRDTLYHYRLTATNANGTTNGSDATFKTYAKSISGFIGGEGGVNTGGLFTQPRDVALWQGPDANDTSDDKLFVVEGLGNNSRVHRLDGNGNFERLWGKDAVATGAAENTGTGFEVCTTAADCKSAGPVGALKGEMNQPSGLDVDQVSGDVYVWDRQNFRIQKFTKDGAFDRAFGKAVNQTTGGDLCTAASGDVCKAGTTGNAAGQFGNNSQQIKLAVNQATHDVFASDAVNRRILQFDSAGAFIRGWGFGVDTAAAQFQVCTTASTCAAGTSGSANGQFAADQPIHLAIDSSGILYASDTNASSRIIRINTTTPPAAGDATATLLAPIPGTGGPLIAATSSSTSGQLEIDPDTDAGGPDQETLLVARDPSSGDTVVQELAIPTPPTDPITTELHRHTFAAQPLNGGITTSSRGGVIYASLALTNASFPVGCATNPQGCAGLIVLSNGGTPVLGAVSATDAGSTTASLRGVANPNGLGAFQLQYSANGITWQNAGPQRYLSGTAETAHTAQVTGLAPNTTYRLRMTATKITSLTQVSTVTSAEATFLTDAVGPTVTTRPVDQRQATSAVLQGAVNPNGSATTYHLEYGTTTSYGQNVPVPDASVGAAAQDKLVAQPITGLEPNTTYHYRLVADNGVDGDANPANGTAVAGADAMFTTRPADEAPAGRGYELVSPADKVGGQGVGFYAPGDVAATSIGYPSRDGERYGLNSHYGGVLVDSPFAYANDVVNAQRAPQGWVSRSPVARRNYGSAQNRFLIRQASSDDLEVTSYTSNGGHVGVFPEVEALLPITWEVPTLGDWEGRWEAFGPTAEAGQTNPGLSSPAAVAGDGSHVVLSSSLRGLTGAGDPTLDQPDGSSTVYIDDVSAGLSDTFPGEGVREPVNVCTAGTVLPSRLASGKLDDAGGGCPAPLAGRDASLIDQRGARLVSANDSGPLAGVISRDGSRVFFATPPGVFAPCSGEGATTQCPSQLFVRVEAPDGTVSTRWVSRPSVAGQDASLLGETRFEAATPDGDKVYFSTTSPLTADDPNGQLVTPTDPRPIVTGTASTSSWDVYEYDFTDSQDDDPGAGTLTRVTAGPTQAADASFVQPTGGAWAVRVVSDDGDRVYVATSAPLPGVAAPANGTITEPGGTATSTQTANLYLYDRAKPLAQRWRFIARLPRTSPLGSCASTGALAGDPLLRDGDNVGIRPLNTSTCVAGTADGGFVTFFTDGRLTGDDPDAASGDVYGYDADSDELVRLSASQGGAGGGYECATVGVPAETSCFGDAGFDGETRRTALRVVTDPVGGERVAFFQSKARLTAEDSDDQYDVYEWRDGDLSLLSAGTSQGAYYAGNSRDGQDVFVATKARLSWQDFDAVLDIYDAREGGGIPQPPAPPAPCLLLADGCQGGGVGSTPTDPKTSDPDASGGDDFSAGERKTLTVAGLSARARKRAARSGVLPVSVVVSQAGRVSAVAKGRIGKRMKRVAHKSVQMRKAGKATLRLRLNRAARRRLAAGRTLGLRVEVSSAGARGRAITVRLPGGQS